MGKAESEYDVEDPEKLEKVTSQVAESALEEQPAGQNFNRQHK